MALSFSWYLAAILAAWVVAQGTKYVVAVVKNGDIRQLRHLYLSGNMPSAHSSSVVALLTMVGASEGVDSALFAVMALFAGIVMYDAVMVRRSSGEQGEAILEIIKKQKSDIKPPRVARGHTPLEVAVGGLVGFTVALGILLLSQAGF